MTHYKKTTCRACNGADLNCFLSLGPTPLANSFLKSPDEAEAELSFTLDLYFCRTCSLVQLLDVIDPETLFRNYIYVTGTSETIAAHNVHYAKTLVDYQGLRPEDLVVEVASNDGSLLKCFKEHGVRTLGIEPAKNIAEMARRDGIETIDQFFNSETAKLVRETHGQAKAVIGNNVLAHVDDTQDFLLGCKELLTDDGLVVIEVPYLKELLDRLEYDTVYHEHLCYFSVTTLLRLCQSVGLSLVRLEHMPIHGGSLRMYAGREGHYPRHAQDVLDQAESERAAGITDLERYQKFAVEVANNRLAIRSLLKDLKRRGKTVAGYGAPAKGNTLLNYCGINTDLVSYTVDKSPLKVGLYTPGMHLPVLPAETLLERQPDYTLILAWNFADEIMRQQTEYHDRGGRFIIPIPEPEIV